MPAPKEYLTRDQVAADYNLDPRHLLRWANSDRFPKPALRLSGRVYRWLRSDIEKWIKQQLK